MKRNLQVEIMRLLMITETEEMYLMEIANKLHAQSSHIYYHVNQMVRKGILVREEEGGRVYYRPQPFFGPKNLAAVDLLLKGMATKTGNSLEVLANCLRLFFNLKKI